MFSVTAASVHEKQDYSLDGGLLPAAVGSAASLHAVLLRAIAGTGSGLSSGSRSGSADAFADAVGPHAVAMRRVIRGALGEAAGSGNDAVADATATGPVMSLSGASRVISDGAVKLLHRLYVATEGLCQGAGERSSSNLFERVGSYLSAWFPIALVLGAGKFAGPLRTPADRIAKSRPAAMPVPSNSPEAEAAVALVGGEWCTSTRGSGVGDFDELLQWQAALIATGEALAVLVSMHASPVQAADASLAPLATIARCGRPAAALWRCGCEALGLLPRHIDSILSSKSSAALGTLGGAVLGVQGEPRSVPERWNTGPRSLLALM